MKKDSQLTNEIKKLQYQLSYSEHINKELSEYLRALCQKTGLPMRKTQSVENVSLINTQSHLQELFYVQPLLLSYQYKIQLLEEQLHQFRNDSDALLKFGQEIVNENNFLRKELQTKNQYILKSQEVGLNASFLKLDNHNLIEKNTLLQDKNKFLMQKIRELQEISGRERLNSNKPNINLASTIKELKVEKERFKATEIDLIQLEKKLEVVNNQLNNEKTVTRDMERKGFQLENEVLSLKNQLKINRQQNESYQVSHDSTINNLELEVQTLKNQLMIAQRRQNDLFTKSMALESQTQDKNAKLHNLSLQNTQLQTNNNNILQMLETYEVKVNTLNKKVKSLQVQIKDYNESLLTLRKQNEMVDWKLCEKEKQIERKEGEWKKQKERTGKLWQDRFQSMKRALTQEKQSLYDEIQDLRVNR